MDLKKIVDQVKDAAEDLKEKAEAKIKETRDALDKDHDNIPDAMAGLADKAKTLAGQVQDKAKVLAGQAEAKIKETRDALDKDHDNIPDAMAGLADKAKTLAGQVQDKAKDLAGQAGEKAKEVAGIAKEKLDQATTKLGELKADVGKVVDSAREGMGKSDKDSNKS